MTSRERLFASLRGESTDHVPAWLLFPHDRLGCYADVRNLEAYRPVCEKIPLQAVTLNRRSLDIPLYGAGVSFRREDRGNGVVRDWVEGPGGVRLFSERGPGHKKALLETDEDLEAWAALPFLTDKAEVRRAVGARHDAYAREKEAFPPELGAMMLALGEPVAPLYHLSNLESYAVWSLTRADVVKGVLDRLMERERWIYKTCLEREMAEVYFLVGSELASPPLLRRETFMEWVVPYAGELIALVRGAGEFAIQHYHGQIREILGGFAEMAPDALHTIEAPPVGNCTLAQAYDATGNAITLVGNIQYDEFRSRAPDEMRAAVRAVLEECRGKRLILSPSAGPFDPDPPRRVIENYLAFLDEAWRWGEWNIS